MTRQARHQAALRAKGLCIDCGDPQDPDSASRCTGCLVKRRKRMRKATGSRAWRPNGPGRPPITGTPQ